MTVRGRVGHVTQPHSLVLPDRPGLAQRGGIGLGRQRVQVLALLGEHLQRRSLGRPVRPLIEDDHLLLAADHQLLEAAVGGEQIGLGRNQVGLSHPDRRFRTTLGLRVVGDACLHLQSVVTAGRDQVRMPHRHSRHPVRGQGAFVVGQQVGRCPAQPAQRVVDAGQHSAQGPVPGRDDDPVPAPCQPGAEQIGLAELDDRAEAPVVLQPHARLGYPRSVAPAVTSAVGHLGLRHRPAHRPLVAGEAHRQQPFVGDVGPDLGVGVVHPLLNLLGDQVDKSWPPNPTVGVVAGVTPLHVMGDRLVVGACQLGRGTVAAGEVERFEYFHDLLVGLGHGGSSDVGRDVAVLAYAFGDRGAGQGGEFSCPSTGRFGVRQWGIPCPPVGSFYCPRSLSSSAFCVA